MRLFQIIKKVTVAAAAGASQWRAAQTVGLVHKALLRWAAPQAAGLAASQAPTHAVSAQTAGLVATARVAAGSVGPAQTAGLVQSGAPAQLAKPPQVSGADITQTTITLTRRIGADSITHTELTGVGFNTPENAVGRKDGVFATLVGNAAGARAGTITGTIIDPDSTKTQFTIDSVKLYYFWRTTGDALNSASKIRSYRSTNIAQVTLATSTGNIDHTANGEVFDITSTIAGNWANLNGFRTVFRASNPLGNTAQTALDAVELEIVCSPLVTLN